MLTTAPDIADATFDATDFAARVPGATPQTFDVETSGAMPQAPVSTDMAAELAEIELLKKHLWPAVEAGKIAAIREMRQLFLTKLRIVESCDRRKRLDAKEAAAADKAARLARPLDYAHELVAPPSSIVHPPGSRLPGTKTPHVRVAGATPRKSAGRTTGAMPRPPRKRSPRPAVAGATPQTFDPAVGAIQKIFGALAGAMPQAPGEMLDTLALDAGTIIPPSPADRELTGLSREVYICALHLLRDKLRERAASEDAAAAEVNSASIIPATHECTVPAPNGSDLHPRPP